MKIEEIKKLLEDYGEDKMQIAVKHEVSYRYIDMILNGQRGLNSETAEAILSDLKKIARINKNANARKAAVIES